MGISNIYNYIKIDDQTFTSGQPTEVQLRSAAAEGVQVVINLATLSSDNALKDERAIVRGLGMEYIHIPVLWDNPTAADFAEFVRVMQKTAGKTILIHCAANYRVTAFYSLYAMKTLGWSSKQADTLMGSIWDDDEYPVWKAFVKRMRESSELHSECSDNNISLR